MRTIFVGSEAVARGELTRGRLRSAYRPMFPDIYQARTAQPSLYASTAGAWLWSGRQAVVTGRAAAALHGAQYVDADSPIELVWQNNRPPRGIVTHRSRIGDDEVIRIDGMSVASVERTALDLGRYLPRGQAVRHLDALARATGLTDDQVGPLAERYRSSRGVRRARQALALMDPGAQSPRETWLRLLVMDAGYPRPLTQIPVFEPDGFPFAYLDMGWEHLMIGLEYDGKQHQTDRARYVWDERRLRRIQSRGWLHVRVIKEDRPRDILQRLREAWARRESEGRVA
ncbi:hypothetical protein ACWDTP_33700 [Mycobacterium sp. NPDC003449]